MFSEHDIDIEKPEHLSEEHTVYVYSPLVASDTAGTLTLQGQVSIPVHLRYHRPTSGDNLAVSVFLEPPHIYIHCPGKL